MLTEVAGTPHLSDTQQYYRIDQTLTIDDKN